MSIAERFREHQVDKKKKEQEQATGEIEERRVSVEKARATLESALPLLRVEDKLTEIRDNVWGIGEISVGSPEVFEEIVGFKYATTEPRVGMTFVLEASWPFFVPAGEGGTRSEWDYVSWPDHISDHVERLEITVSSSFRKAGVEIAMSGEKIEFRRVSFVPGENSVQLFEDLLLQGCIDRGDALPFNQRESEDATIIQKKAHRRALPHIS